MKKLAFLVCSLFLISTAHAEILSVCLSGRSTNKTITLGFWGEDTLPYAARQYTVDMAVRTARPTPDGVRNFDAGENLITCTRASGSGQNGTFNCRQRFGGGRFVLTVRPHGATLRVNRTVRLLGEQASHVLLLAPGPSDGIYQLRRTNDRVCEG